jgi:NAD-dependent SIR2 family protein deacetylase
MVVLKNNKIIHINHKKKLVLTNARMIGDAGIIPFRDTDGLWKR